MLMVSQGMEHHTALPPPRIPQYKKQNTELPSPKARSQTLAGQVLVLQS